MLSTTHKAARWVVRITTWLSFTLVFLVFALATAYISPQAQQVVRTAGQPTLDMRIGGFTAAEAKSLLSALGGC